MPISLNGSTGITVNGATLIGANTTDTLTNKTLTSAVLSGTATGTYTLAGTPTITAPVLSGTATGTYTLGGTPSLAATALTGTIAAARLPAGSVLQVVKAQSTGTTTTTSNADLAGLSASITVFANSRILIHATSGHYSTALSSSWFGTGQLRVLTSGGTQIAGSEHQGIITANVEQCFQHTLMALTDAQAAGTYSYKLNGTSTTGGSIQWNRSGGIMGWLILMEVAA